MAAHPVTIQPHGGPGTEHLFGFSNDWHAELSSATKECPECLIAQFCSCFYNGYLTERAGENFWAGCLASSAALIAVRTKIRAAYKIKGDLCSDVCLAVCCFGACLSIQTKKELDRHGIPGHGPRWLGNK